MRKLIVIDNKGFTLVELMVAIAILGLVLMAISTTFIGQQRQGLTQNEVAESQQSARIGLETLVRDIRRAGLMIPNQPAAYPIEDAGTFNITITVGSELDGYASILNPADSDGNITGLTSPITFTVDTTRDFQSRVGATARILRPSTGMEPSRDEGASDVCYTISALTPQGVSPATITLTFSSSTSLPTGGIPDIAFKPGDTILLHDCTTSWPVRIRYSVEPNPETSPDTATLRTLTRWIDLNGNGIVDTGEAENVAQNIVVPDADANGTPDDRDGNGLADIFFRYLDKNGNETTSLANIASVNIDLTTATTRNVAQLSNQARTRQLTSLIRVKNNFME